MLKKAGFDRKLPDASYLIEGFAGSFSGDKMPAKAGRWGAKVKCISPSLNKMPTKAGGWEQK